VIVVVITCSAFVNQGRALALSLLRLLLLSVLARKAGTTAASASTPESLTILNFSFLQFFFNFQESSILCF
jgi:hypothetical protein